MDEFTPHLTPAQKRRVRHTKMVDILHIALLVIVGIALLGCALTDKKILGQLIVGGFAVIGLVTRIEAHMVFKLALATFAVMPISAIFAPYSEIPENMAIFSFLLLLVGVGFSLLELLTTKSARKKRS